MEPKLLRDIKGHFTPVVGESNLKDTIKGNGSGVYRDFSSTSGWQGMNEEVKKKMEMAVLLGRFSMGC